MITAYSKFLLVLELSQQPASGEQRYCLVAFNKRLGLLHLLFEEWESGGG